MDLAFPRRRHLALTRPGPRLAAFYTHAGLRAARSAWNAAREARQYLVRWYRGGFVIPRVRRRSWNLVPSNAKRRLRLVQHGSVDLTAADTYTTPLVLRADNVADCVYDGFTTSTPAVGFNDIQKEYQSYHVLGSRVTVKAWIGGGTSDNYFMRVRFHDKHKPFQATDDAGPPDKEWVGQVINKRWKRCDASVDVKARRLTYSDTATYSLRRVKRTTHRVDAADTVEQPAGGGVYVFSTWTPRHNCGTSDVDYHSDRFTFTVEFATDSGKGSSVSNLFWEANVEYLVHFYDPKIVNQGTSYPDTTGVSVAGTEDPSDRVVLTTSVATAPDPLWNAPDDTNPA